MSSIFISYSRKDIEFARRVVDALAENDLDTWIDWQSIPKGEDWKQEIDRGIEAAETFIFLMSPDSAKSEICNLEIAHALENNKRIIPIVIRDINLQDFHSEISGKEISRRNWIFCRDQTDDFNNAIQDTIETIQTDYDWVKYHTKLQVRALEWERSDQERSLLYRGKELGNAEIQLAANTSKDPIPTELQHSFVLKSRQATDRQRRVITSVTITGIIVLAVLAVTALFQANEATSQAATAQANEAIAQTERSNAEASAEEARRQANIARAGELAALALIEQDKHFDLALLFGLESFYTQETLRSKGTLLTLLNSHPGWDVLSSGHRGGVSSTAFSPDGEILASGDSVGNIILWELRDRTVPSQLAVFEGNIISSVQSIAFSPDGKTLAAGYSDFFTILNINIPVDTIILWDISDPTAPSQLTAIEGNGYSVNSVAFGPDGETLISGDDNGTIILWDINDPTTPSQVAAFAGNKYNAVTDIAISPDGMMLASGYSDIGVIAVNALILWDISDPTSPSQLATLEGHSSSVYSVAFSPDGETLASGGSDNALILWDIRVPTNPSQLVTLDGQSSSVINVAFSPDGGTLASVSGGDITFWDISDLTNPSQQATLGGPIGNVSFNPDGKTLAAGNGDNILISWNFHDLTTPARLASLEESSFNSIAFSPDEKILAAGGSNNIILWNINDPTAPSQLAKLEGNLAFEGVSFSIVLSIAFSPDGKTLASGYSDQGDLQNGNYPNNTIILWDISNPTAPSQLATPEGHDESVNSVAFSPDGKTLASGSFDNTIILWDISNRDVPSKLITLDEHNEAVYNVAFSPDGKTLVSQDSTGTIILWNVSDPTSPSQYTTLEGPGGFTDNNLAFNPDGKTLASGGSTIFLWDISDLTSPSQLATLEGFGGTITSLSFSPDGKTLALGGSTIFLWDISDLTAPSQYTTLEGSGDVDSVAFSPDGKTLVSGGREGIIVWDMNPLSWVQRTCQRVGRNFTLAEWAQYFPGEEYRKTCEQWPAGEQRK